MLTIITPSWAELWNQGKFLAQKLNLTRDVLVFTIWIHHQHSKQCTTWRSDWDLIQPAFGEKDSLNEWKIALYWWVNLKWLAFADKWNQSLISVAEKNSLHFVCQRFNYTWSRNRAQQNNGDLFNEISFFALSLSNLKESCSTFTTEY